MAIQNILTFDDPTLRKQSKRVIRFDEGLQKLINDLIDTMLAAPGLGLSAPQIGVLRRVIVVLDGNYLDEESEKENTKPEVIVAVNPKIVAKEGEVTTSEGCLSFPGMIGEVTRFEKVKVVGLDRYGNKREIWCEGIVARAFQHEIDHLNGIVLPERAEKGTYRKIEKEEKEKEDGVNLSSTSGLEKKQKLITEKGVTL